MEGRQVIVFVLSVAAGAAFGLLLNGFHTWVAVGILAVLLLAASYLYHGGEDRSKELEQEIDRVARLVERREVEDRERFMAEIEEASRAAGRGEYDRAEEHMDEVERLLQDR